MAKIDKKTFCCFIIGEGSLPILCAEVLLNGNHTIHGIISADATVSSWARRNKLPLYHPNEGFIPALSKQAFDYLFSINNPHVLSAEVLGLRKRCAINYHDSPLPKYAGIHATSWAILQRETAHAISWHVMEERTDTGAILKQPRFAIEPGETAFTLNGKCYEEALAAFTELVVELAEGRARPVEQDLAGRSYFGKYKRPDHGAIIQWQQTAGEIEALVRALDFGTYPNPLGMPKLAVGESLYIVRDVRAFRCETAAAPGTLLDVSPDGIRIAAADDAIIIGQVCTLQGKTIAPADLVATHALQTGQVMETVKASTADRIDVLNRQICKHETFWIDRLSSLEPLNCPYLKAHAPGHAAREVKSLPIPLSAAAIAYAEAQGLSPQQVLAAAFIVYLSRIGGMPRVELAYASADLTQAVRGVENFFAGQIPLTIDCTPTATFGEICQAMEAERQRLAQAETYALDVVTRHASLRDKPELQDLAASVAILEVLQSGADCISLDIGLALCIPPLATTRSQSLAPGGTLVFDLGRIGIAEVERLAGHLQTLLEGTATNPGCPVGDLPLLTAPERRQLLETWNDTASDYPRDRCLHQLFEAQAERDPAAAALVCEDRQMSYGELNAQANRLARHLLGLGVKPDDRVAICVERSLPMVVGLLAILKAGGAYVPLDPKFPPARLAYMLEDSTPVALLVGTGSLNSLSGLTGLVPVINLDADAARWADQPAKNLDPEALGLTPEHLAYVIYTSGSTGKPKGVMVEHRNVCHEVAAMQNYHQFCPEDRVLQFFSVNFDASVEEIFGALLAGATLVLRTDDWVAGPAKFWGLCEKHGITWANVPTLYWQQLTQDDHAAIPATLRQLVFGGEAVSGKALENWFRREGHRPKLFFAYGPTESTINATIHEPLPDSLSWHAIGRPIPNVQTYILDGHCEPTPIGVAGELHLSGAGLARGYLHQAELTAQKFIPHPFSNAPDARLYKTGDLARYLPDGTIEFLGRLDTQVKIRGYRIELGEIESVLSQHPQVREAVVQAREDSPGDKRLVAYLTTKSAAVPPGAEFRDFLKRTLPEYMVPSAYVLLEALPLAPNGKLDRKSLPAPDQSRQSLESVFAAPRTPTEELLAAIWAELLGVDRVGIHDNFFELGGHSLLATQAIVRIQKQFSVDMPLRTLFEAPTVAVLAERLQYPSESKPSQRLPFTRLPRQRQMPSVFVQSFAQQRLWFLERLIGASGVYNLPWVLRLRGTLDTEALSAALTEIICRHEALRTTFAEQEGAPVQVIQSSLPVPLSIVDLRGYPEERRKAEAERIIQNEAKARFDLENGPLLRARLLRLGEADHVFQLTFHHIITDGWSMNVLVRELSALYKAFSQGQPSPLPELPIQYADYAVWQRGWLQGEAMERLLDYWKRRLAAAPTLELPTDKPRPAEQSFRGESQRFILPPALAEGLKALGLREGATLFMTLLAAFQVLLHRYSGQDDMVVGTPTSGRSRFELEGLIGFFVNTLALRTDLSGNPGFCDLLARVREVTLGAFDNENQDLPFEKLVESLHLQRDLSRNPLFQVMLAFQNTPDANLQLNELTSEILPINPETSMFDLALELSETPHGLVGRWEYATDLFEAATIARLAGHFQTLLEGIIAQPEARLSDLPLLTAPERRQLLETWNDTAADYPRDRCLHQLFEAQAERDPAAAALVCEDRQMSYGELNAQANRLARHLLGLGVKPDDRVAICVERSLPMVVGLLAILKAGGAYVPLDPKFPPARLAYMLEDSAPVALLVGTDSLNSLSGLTGLVPVINLDADAARWADQPATNLDPEALGLTPEHLAYVIYTSGSTGKPKGVMVEHRNVCHEVAAMQNYHQFCPEDRVLQFFSVNFDASVEEIFGALLAGATLVLRTDDWVAGPAKFWGLCEKHGITWANVPTLYWQQLTQDDQAAIPATLRQLVFGGEAVSGKALENWFRREGHRPKLFFAYGPTESTINATIHEPLPDSLSWHAIGRPIPNVQTYILDGHCEPTPIGVAGELHLSGAGLARGYLHQAELTAQKFIPHPFSNAPDARLYKTGDLARYLPDGTIEFLGRLDTQVKIRGYRIELGEIESVLSQHPQVREAVVQAREDSPGDKRLVAYLTTKSAAVPPGAEFRDFLKRTLPEYMVPSAYVLLEALPLAPNGKLDRKSLPAPDQSRQSLESVFAAPRTPTEELLAAIWAELLGVDRVGIHDNFFELGGHSLLAVALIERMRRAGLHADVRALFTTPTLAELAAAVGGGAGEVDVPPNRMPLDCEAITPEMLTLVALEQADIDRIVASVPGGATNVQDIYPLAPLQEGILFHHLMEAEGDTYLSYSLLAFDTREKLDGFLAALQAVVARHDVLRTAIAWEELPEPVQVVWREAFLPVEEVVLEAGAGDAARQLAERFDPRHYRIDLRAAPLMRAFAARDEAHGRWLLMMLSHHLLADHTTLEILLKEIQAHLRGQADQLPPPLPYRNFVAQARLGVKPEEHEAFFRRMLGDVDEPTAPFGLLDVQGDGSGIQEAQLRLEEDLARRIRDRARALKVGAASIFHLAWAQVLARMSGREDVVFGTVLFGRMQGGEGADRVMGLFMNTLPVRIQTGGDSVAEGVRQTHGLLAGLLRHEHAPLALAQRCSAVSAPAPLFTALLNYRHSQDAIDIERIGVALGWEVVELDLQERTNYPIALNVDDLGEGFLLTAQTRQPAEPQRVCGYMRTVLENLVEALESVPDTAVRAVDVLPEDERRQLLEAWNDTAEAYDRTEHFHQRFARQAQRVPDAVAVVSGAESLSYAELDGRSNQLSHYLKAHGVGPNVLVGICMERSVDLLVGLLGIFKAGGAYVPLDPRFPKERLAMMVEDSAAPVILTQADLAGTLPSHNAQVVRIDTDWPTIARESRHSGGYPLQSEDLAYVIFTSGSTGRPKSVQIPQRALTNLLLSFGRRVSFDETDVMLAVTTLSFDIAGLELYLPLMTGARIVLANAEEAADGDRLSALLQEHAVTVMQATPATWRLLLTTGWTPSPSLRMWCGGEALPVDLAKALLVNGSVLWNLYGPTETTIWSTVQRVETEDDARSIGRPIGNTTVYLVDAHFNLVPVGVPGELLIGGTGVALGYGGQPALTAEKFVPDRFSAKPGTLLYRTSDKARYREDGKIEFLGRLDTQVKIRGYRIELGEIETILRTDPEIHDAAVTVREDQPNQQRLVAYLVLEHEIRRPDLVAEVRTLLRERLPEYMVPSSYVILEALPLTPNGKVDRKALPAPDLSRGEQQTDFVAPRTPLEELLAAIWAEVLGVDRVGVHDNFFELGGHSLLAMSLIERMRRAGLHADVRALFTTPTLAELAAAVGGGAGEVDVPPNRIPLDCEAITPEMLTLVALEQADIDRIVASVPGGATNVQDIYPLAPLQEGILFHHLMEAEGDTYLSYSLLAFDTREKLDGFLAALQAVVARHDVLRTAIAWEELPEPVQVVWREAFLPVEEVVLEAGAGDAARQLAERFDPRHYRIDLRAAPLMRAFAARDEAHGRWLLMMLSHHLLADHTTLEILLKEIQAHLRGQADQLPPPLPYRNFVAQARLGVKPEEHEAFFRRMLGDVDEPTAPFGLLDVQGDGSGIQEAQLRLEEDLARRIRDRARALKVGAASIFHLAWAQVLARMSGREDVVFGTVLFGRMQGGEGADRVMGLFMNTLPVRIQTGGDSVAEGVRQTHGLLAGLLRHEHAPLALAQRCSAVSAPAPLFTALLNYRHSQDAIDIERIGVALGWEVVELDLQERTNYPIALNVDDLGEGFLLTAQTRQPAEPQRVCGYMRTVLENLVEALESVPDTAVRAVDVLPEDERRQLLEAWNDTAEAYDRTEHFHQRFARQAQRVPDAVAVVSGAESLSYAELDGRSNQLSHYLKAHGVGPNVLVGICMERSVDLLVGLLGIFKAGGAYVPLDPRFPKERLAMMVEDSAAPVILTQADLAGTLPSHNAQVVRIDTDWPTIARESRHSGGYPLQSEDLAYVIFTSGSTGRPKSVQIPQRALTNLLLSFGRRVSFDETDVMLAVTTLSFDIAGLELYLPLMTGARIVLANAEEAADGDRLSALLQEHAVTVMQATPATWRLLLTTGWTPSPSLRMWCGGEALPVDLAKALLVNGSVLWNLYGPTETTIWSTVQRVETEDDARSIGRPIGNTTVYLVDAHFNLVPVGVPGELLIGGTGVALGYGGQTALTAEKFIPDRFSAKPGTLLYRTGDKARYREDGKIEFLGRLDTQVKIRGYRIELGEIETILRTDPEIHDAAVTVREDQSNQQRLVAYLVLEHEIRRPDLVAEVRTLLRERLPEYMVPSSYVILEALPLTPNGKVDRKALPAPDLSRGEQQTDFVAPRTPLEELLAAIWTEVLGVDRVGIHDNFFELGGHSLLAMQAIVRIQKQISAVIPIRTLFGAPTIAEFAEVVSNDKASALNRPIGISRVSRSAYRVKT